MASTTGIPDTAVEAQDVGEDEPLLGRPGDASQTPEQPLYYNLFSGSLPPSSISPENNS